MSLRANMIGNVVILDPSSFFQNLNELIHWENFRWVNERYNSVTVSYRRIKEIFPNDHSLIQNKTYLYSRPELYIK